MPNPEVVKMLREIEAAKVKAHEEKFPAPIKHPSFMKFIEEKIK